MKSLLSAFMSLLLLLSFGCSPNILSETDENSKVDSTNINKILKDKIDDTNINKIPQDKIFGVFKRSASWAFDPTPENLIINSTAVAKIKVLSIKKPVFFNELDPNTPLTPVKIDVTDIISGELQQNENTIYISGGTILISDLLESKSKESAEKMGLLSLDNQKKNTMYIDYTSDYDYDFIVDQEYIVILNKQANNIYTVFGNGYGIFYSNNYSLKSTKNFYNNVITGNAFDFEKE